MFHLKQTMKRRKANDRIPIPRSAFQSDAESAGLRVTRWMATRPGISKQWYATMESVS
jgi:hypothetical protein